MKPFKSQEKNTSLNQLFKNTINRMTSTTFRIQSTKKFNSLEPFQYQPHMSRKSLSSDKSQFLFQTKNLLLTRKSSTKLTWKLLVIKRKNQLQAKKNKDVLTVLKKLPIMMNPLALIQPTTILITLLTTLMDRTPDWLIKELMIITCGSNKSMKMTKTRISNIQKVLSETQEVILLSTELIILKH